MEAGRARIIEDGRVNVINHFMYPELLIYLGTGSCSNLTIMRWYTNGKSIIDIQKSNNATYQNTEQEWTKLLIKQYILHKTNDFPYQMYYIYR